MRLVIVEDEAKTREGLVHMIEQKTDYEIVGVAGNGAEGLRIVFDTNPDLVISDICMAGMNGLDMLQEMRNKGLDMQVVLLTGYPDFEYARSALKLQVVEYALKPLEIDKFLRTLHEIEMRIQKRKKERISPEQIIWSYASCGEEMSLELRPVLEERLRVNDKVWSTIFLIRPVSMASETIQEMMRCVREQMEILCIDDHYIFQVPEERGFYLMITDTKRQQNLCRIFESRVAKKLSEISDAVFGAKHILGIKHFREALIQLRELVKYSFSLPENTVVCDETAEMTDYKKIEYPDYLEQSVIRAIRRGNREKILEKGNDFTETVINSGAHPACIKEHTMRFAAAILRIVAEIRGNYEREHEITYSMNGIAETQTRKEVAYQLDKIISSAANMEQDFVITENGMVMNAVTLVRENYNQDITLAETARCCGVTQEYLSKVFSKEVGMGFNNFLQNYRVSMAKRMLRSGEYKISEVADAVGYRDQKYFTKVFKKLSGVTPAEYKRENGE